MLTILFSGGAHLSTRETERERQREAGNLARGAHALQDNQKRNTGKEANMSGITNWSEALAHPCFWDLHYEPLLWYKDNTDKSNFSLEAFFGCPDEQVKEYFRLLHGEEDGPLDGDEDEDAETPLPPDAEDDAEDAYADYEFDTPPTSVLTLSFPEHYTWTLKFFLGEVSHHIYDPQLLLQYLVIAVSGGNFSLPGLRWAEVKQMVACLQPTWPGPFDLQALYLLLYPIVDPVTSDEYEEVRQTLGTAWEALQVVNPSQLERWVDLCISVYERGRMFRYDAAQGWQEDHPSASVGPEQLWLPDSAGHWFCTSWSCSRRLGAHERFTPFFDMLARHAQPHM
jgi:hypothetical protein